MSGVSLGESHGRPHTLRRCNGAAGADLVDLIDVESDTFHNVILIDVPESVSKRKFQGNTKAKKNKEKSHLRNIIFIDDDDVNENEYPECDLDNDRRFFHDPSPSMRACSTSKSGKEPLDEIGDDCQFVRENKHPVKLSKCKRTYSRKATIQNRYGLTSDSESSSSDDDDFMVDSSGKLREQWHKAALKRKNDTSGPSGFRDSSSEEHPDCSDYSKSSTEKEDLSPESTSRHGEENPACSGMADVHDEHQPAVETENDRSQYISADKGKKCKETAWNYNFHFPNEPRHETSSFKKGLFSGGSSWRTDQSSIKCYPHPSSSNGCLDPGEPSFCKGASSGSGISPEKCVNQENGSWVPDRTSEFSERHDNVNDQDGASSGSGIGHKKRVGQENGKCLPDRTSEFSDRHDDANDQDSENDEGNVEDCITTERERMKETSEYKKALEEELAARQRALAIQAEEARRQKLLRKREKAESMRLLEMEKRQKQRLEEMRETQKKDAENMNLKELMRAEVRKELSRLEMICPDMATMLLGLGINVGGATSHEVRVAYKKALLKFHPDRASRSDLRQQVEAEEKFKLISRMKDKYLPALGQ